LSLPAQGTVPVWCNTMLRDDSDASWERYGRDDPYYGVLTDEDYRRENLTPDLKRRFLDSGEQHIARLVALIERQFGMIDRAGTAIDFGCGVCRLAIPLARRFAQVIGIDVSPSMIAEAKRNCAAAGVDNIAFAATPDGPADAALVHSYIVLQHIPLRSGEALVERLLDRLRPGGVGALHVTFARRASLLRKAVHWSRANVAPLNPLINRLQGRRRNDPLMQMNDYDLGGLLSRLKDRGIGETWIELAENGGQYSALLLFRRP
jgi:trans-aconitate methyltransferase